MSYRFSSNDHLPQESKPQAKLQVLKDDSRVVLNGRDPTQSQTLKDYETKFNSKKRKDILQRIDDRINSSLSIDSSLV